jgi:hypothetical protein
MLPCNRTGSRGYRHGQDVPTPDEVIVSSDGIASRKGGAKSHKDAGELFGLVLEVLSGAAEHHSKYQGQ